MNASSTGINLVDSVAKYKFGTKEPGIKYLKESIKIIQFQSTFMTSIYMFYEENNNTHQWIYPAPAVNSGCPALTMIDFGMFPWPAAGMGWGAVFTPFLIQPESSMSNFIEND